MSVPRSIATCKIATCNNREDTNRRHHMQGNSSKVQVLKHLYFLCIQQFPLLQFDEAPLHRLSASKEVKTKAQYFSQRIDRWKLAWLS